MRLSFVQIDLNIYNIHLFSVVFANRGHNILEYVTSKNLNL